MEYILKTNELCKYFRNCKAIDKLSMSIPKGSIYGLVGKNGSGKTTLIRLICGLQNPTSGDFVLYGKSSSANDISKSRRRMGGSDRDSVDLYEYDCLGQYKDAVPKFRYARF